MYKSTYELMWYEYMPTWFLVYSAIGLIFLAVAVSIDASKRDDSPFGWFIAVLLFNFIGVLAYFITRGTRQSVDMKVNHHQDSKTIRTIHINILNGLISELDKIYPNKKVHQGKEYYYSTTEETKKQIISIILNADTLKIRTKNDEFEKILEIVKVLIRDVKNPNYLNISGL